MKSTVIYLDWGFHNLKNIQAREIANWSVHT